MSAAPKHSSTVRDAAELLGMQIREARLERRWTVRDLAARAGINPRTVSKVERGDPTVALGTAFDLAVLVGVPLFVDDARRLALEAQRGRPALLRRRARPGREPEVDLDF